jgi:hypothetical protein
VEAIPPDQRAVSVATTKAVSPVPGSTSYRRAVKQLLTSVVRVIRTLRSVVAGERAIAPGHPVAIRYGPPYRDNYRRELQRQNRRAERLYRIVPGVFTPVPAKHSKSFSLIDCISVGVDRMQRNFEPMRKQVEVWQKSELTDVTAKVVIYEAFVEGRVEAPKHLARTVHDLYFEPKYEEFRPRTIWSLSNAFTSAFKELDPIPQFRASAKLGEFLEARFSQSF